MDLMSSLFGGTPKMPKLVRQPEPIEKVQQSNIADMQVRKALAKRRRATILANQDMTEANIMKRKLGAAT